MLISRRALNEYLDRELRSFLWMKKLRRDELLEELSRFKVQPKFKTTPWLHQLVCFYIGMCEPRFLFLLDMGLGKSKILSDLITQTQREGDLRRALILVPNVVNMASWKDDLAVHSELEPWLCNVSNIEEKWDRLVDPDGDVTVIDYQGLQWALCEKVPVKPKKKTNKATKVKYQLVPNPKRIRQVQRLYNFVGIDESHKLRNADNLWSDLVGQISASADRVYATTGTVFGKNPEEMWSQFKLVDGGETFGENLSLFHEAFFYASPHDFKGTVWEFDERRLGEVTRMMQHKSIRYDEKEVPEVELPSRVNVIRKVDMAGEQREHFLLALQNLLNAQGIGDPVALEAPWLRMRQIASGYLCWKDADGQHIVYFKENPKMDALEALLSEMGEEKVVICYDYTDTGRMIVKRLNELHIGCEWLYGGTKDKVGVRDKFMHDPKCRVLVMNSEAGGTGNDGLQKAARFMIFYESPTPPITRKQTEKRIHRPGQRSRCFIYDVVMRKSGDQTILDNIAEGRDLFEQVVNGRRLSKKIFDEA